MSDGFLKEVAMPPKAAKQHAERAVPVGTNFLLGRAKSCQWQVFVRRRPPKQGELRTDVNKATMFQGDDSVLRPAIQSSAGEDFSKVFQRHEPKPVFRTIRRRKGFESVRGSGFTA